MIDLKDMLMEPPGPFKWDTAGLADFERNGEDIFIMDRPGLPGMAQAAAGARLHGFKTVVTEAGAEAWTRTALAGLRIDSEPLMEDIATSAISFLKQFDVSEASLRIEVVAKQSCPQFHCDNVRIRMVTTYFGPTTEYVRAEAPTSIRTAPLFALVFLKGFKHPGHGKSILHRSPPMPPGATRLCAILDI